MALLIAGGILLGSGIALDLVFRLQMARFGQWAPLFKGGSFNYAEYHRFRIAHGEPAWPVYLMWVFYICGLGLLVGGFFVYFGTHPQRGS